MTEPCAPKAKTILVIDDVAIIRMFVEEILGELGYIVVGASDGTAGMEMLRSDLAVDLLITDIGLPDGLDGRQVAAAARAEQPNLKVLFITGQLGAAVIDHPHAETSDDVLMKPFSIKQLIQKVAAILS